MHRQSGGRQTGLQHWQVLPHAGAEGRRDDRGMKITTEYPVLLRVKTKRVILYGFSCLDFDQGLDDACQEEQKDLNLAVEKKYNVFLNKVINMGVFCCLSSMF